MASTSQQPDEISLFEEDLDVVIPLDYVMQRINVVREDLSIEEDGLFAISKAAELFARFLIYFGSKEKTSEMTYDSIAEVINSSNFSTLKDFFPYRQIYGEIADKVARAEIRYQEKQPKDE